MTNDPSVAEFAMLLGQWFAVSLGRKPTRAESAVVLGILGQMPKPCSEDDLMAALDRAAAAIGCRNRADLLD